MNTGAAIDNLITQYAGIKLDIGCGQWKNKGHVGLDIRPLEGVDIVHDVTVFPWPLPGECVIQAWCSHLVEHINPANFGFVNFMNEVWRVMKPEGDFFISCPHGYSPGYLQDPTHINALNENTWLYFDPDPPGGNAILYNIYQPKPWRIVRLVWDPSANMEIHLVKRAGANNGL